MTDAVELAERLADMTLLPRALETDRSELLPVANLDALADAGLYGLFGPVDAGGFGADMATASMAVEHLASGCLTTALVWLQHHSLVGNLLMGPESLRTEWLGELTTGARRSGIVFAGLLPGPSTLHASRRDGGWVLDGTAPWVSGWGRIDMLQIAARGPDDTVVTVVLDRLERSELTARRHRLVALDASGTVQLSFDGLTISDDRVLSVVAHDPAAATGASLRLNGSLALGVVRRCCALIGPSALDDELDEHRALLDGAGDDDMADARAAAAALASRAANTLVVHTGSRAIEVDQHAQRLAREAMFVLVFGSRPAIKTSLLDRL